MFYGGAKIIILSDVVINACKMHILRGAGKSTAVG